MGIQELEVKGFRSLRDVRWEPGKLNVLIGPNGAGKSNLLRVLELSQQAATGQFSETILRQGGIIPLLWDRQAENLAWSFSSRLPGLPPLKYEIELKPQRLLGTYYIANERLTTKLTPLFTRDTQKLKTTKEEFDLEYSAIGNDQTALSTFTSPLRGGTSRIFDFRFKLSKWAVYHDLRVDRQAPIREPAVARIEQHVASDGQNLIPVLHTLYTGNRDFKKSLDAAMRAAFGSDYDEIVFPPAADQRVQLRLRWRSLKTEQSAADLSDGTLRFLLLIAILANLEPGDLIAIDEPETGLHPGMFPIIAELAQEAAERTQVIFTTHSPQFLDAFRDQPPTTTVAEWVDGETHLSVLDGDELQRWLKEYSLGALFRSGELEAMA